MTTLRLQSAKSRRLILHIGSPKTGTTALQHFLTSQRGALAQQKILYPFGGSGKGAGHHILGASIFPGRPSPLEGQSRDDALSASIGKIKAEVDALDPHTVILSTEYLWGYLSQANILRLLAPFEDWDITIVAYLRRQDLLAQSLYIQAVKGGEARSFEEWLVQAKAGPKGGFDYFRVLQAWQTCGLDPTILVRVYEKGQLDRDVCEDFIQHLLPGVTVPFGPASGHANAAPGMATIELLKRVSQTIEDKETANAIRRRIIAQSPPRQLFEPLAYFTQGDAQRFLAEYENGSADVARHFLDRADGRLFYETPPADGERLASDVSDGEILDRLVMLLPRFVDAAAIQKKKMARRKQA